MNREYHKWFSSRLARDMELLVFGHAGARVLVFPTRQGRFYDYENWRQVEAVADWIEAGRLQLFCLDSIDSETFYCFDRPPQERIGRHRLYEDYVLQEVLPLADCKNPDGITVAHGCSIGAYHAVNIALRHPRRFNRLVAFSGRYDLTRPAGVFPDLFAGYYDQDIYFHTPAHFLQQLHDHWTLEQLRQLDIVITVGEQDSFLDSTQELCRILDQKGIAYRLAVCEGEAHRASAWRQMAKVYLA